MGKFQKGILGGFSGTVGTIVGASWRGLDILRSRPRKTNRPPTEAQLEQREKFKLVTQFLRPMRPVLRLYFGQDAAQKSKSNLATAYHLTEAIIGDYPDFAIDYQKVIIAKGELLGFEALSVAPQAGATLQISWTDNSGQGQAKSTDTLVAVAYNQNQNDTRYIYGVSARSNGNYTMVFPANWSGDTVHCWVSVSALNNKLYGNSAYFGPLTLL